MKIHPFDNFNVQVINIVTHLTKYIILGGFELVFQQILLTVLATFHNERTISAAYHLLRGKRSGQTIQDVGIFKIHAYFGVLPKLSRKKFDAEIDLLVSKNYIERTENGYYRLLEAGFEQANEGVPIAFDGWHYRGNEHNYFARLSLIVQSLSHQLSGIKAFIPIEKNDSVQRWVREFLVGNHYNKGILQQQLLEQMTESLQAAALTDVQRECLIYRLSGYQMAGLTWQQLAFRKHMSEFDMQLYYISALHQWLNELYLNGAHYPLLAQLIQQIRVEVPLTDSAAQTARLYKEGHSIEAISQIRRLKTSTIEDHLVEIAMNDRYFALEEFVTQSERVQVFDAIDAYDTRKLKVLRELLPHLSYFQLRLVLARGQEV